jgi:hypothetical protein
MSFDRHNAHGAETENVIIYGAGRNAQRGLAAVRAMGLLPVCFADNNAMKAHIMIDGIAVLSPQAAFSSHSRSKVYITANKPLKFEIEEFLKAKFNVEPNRILNYESFDKRISCASLEHQIVLEKTFIAPCCHIDLGTENQTALPLFDYQNMSCNQMLDEYLKMRETCIDSINGKDGNVCKGCSEAKESFCDKVFKISNVSFGAGFVCQAKCMYCTHKPLPHEQNIKNLKKSLDFFQRLESEGLISKEAVILLANGEITINPVFREIIETFSAYPCVFATNGFVYCPEITEKLSAGTGIVNVSLDSGTKETFSKIKGGAFEQVTENILKYSAAGAVTLKYIFIPRTNLNANDIDGFINLAAQARANIYLSRDYFNPSLYDREIEAVIYCLEYFIDKAKQSGICLDIDPMFKAGTNGSRITAFLSELGGV